MENRASRSANMVQQPLRVLHAFSEVAGQGCLSVKGLRELGCKADMAVWKPNHFGYPFDYNLHIDKNRIWLAPWYAIKQSCFFLKAVRNYDVFHFHFGRSFFFLKDVPLLKRFGKRVIFEFHGSDLRQMAVHANLDPKSYCVGLKDNVEMRRRNLKIFEMADQIILHDAELLVDIPEKYHHKVCFLPLRVSVENYETNETRSCSAGRFTVVHAPSNQNVKGTVIIEEALACLSQELEFDYKRVEKLDHKKALSIYREADLIVDQIRVGTYGVFAIEAMALGKPVICYLTASMRETLPEDCPIVSADEDNINDVLKSLLQDKTSCAVLGAAGSDYARKYHDYHRVARLLFDIYCGQYHFKTSREAFAAVAAYSDESRMNEEK